MRIQRREAGVLAILAVAGVALFVITYPRMDPLMQAAFTMDRSGAILKARTLAENLELEADTFDVDNVVIVWKNIRMAFLATHDEAASTARTRYRHHQPPVAWKVKLQHTGRAERFEVLLNPSGEVVEYLHTPPDQDPGVHLTAEEARSLALDALSERLSFDLSDYRLVDAQEIQREARTDHVFTWQRTEAALDSVRLRLSATVRGEVLSGWTFSSQLPAAFEQRYQSDLSTRRLLGFAQALVVNILWVSALIFFLVRFRAGEIGLRGGFIVALLMLVIYTTININAFPVIKDTLSGMGQFNISGITFTLLGAIFVPMALFFLWSTGESFAREAWPKKLWVVDGLFAGNFFFPTLGANTLRGAALGFIQLGALALWTLGATVLGNATPLGSSQHAQLLSSYVPALSGPFLALYLALMTVIYVFVFVAASLKRYIKRPVVVYGLTVLIGTPILEVGSFSTLWWSLGSAFLLMGLSLYFFIRYDVFTVLQGHFFTFTALFSTLCLAQPSISFVFAGSAGWSILVVLIGLAVFAYLRGTPVDERTVEPSYVQHITERERLKMELDIARRAQLRMLPREIPSLDGIEIAAFSEPAREVGGDYYDFFAMTPDRLGLAVGDISGKGMPAALYMTLLKGSLQSRVEANSRPLQVLSHINRTFYATAERNIFATLFFGILHVEHRQLQFARAGHNPFVLYRADSGNAELVRPPGIGIGLEKGPTFERVTTEECLRLELGDVLIFYTDGLVEARNQQGDELGEKRLLNLVRTYPNDSAEALLSRIRSLYQDFVENGEVHDDLTCMVLRIT